MPRFSVIIPFFNSAKYLPFCIDSVLAQTNQDFEAILVDDGSTDNSLALAMEYQKKYPDKIVVLSQQNSGPLSARLSGYAIAKGEYIVHVDSDDELRLNTLEVLEEELSLHQDDLVVFESSRDPTFSSVDKRFPYPQATRIVDSPLNELISLALESFAMNSLWSKCIRSDLLSHLECLNEVRGLKFGEDFLVSILLLDRVESFAYIPKPLYYYRSNSSSTTNTIKQEVIENARIIDGYLSDLCAEWASRPGVQINWTKRNSRSLRTFYNYFISVCNQWPKCDALSELRRIGDDVWFHQYCDDKGAMEDLFFRQRLCLLFVKYGHYNLAFFVFRFVKTASFCASSFRRLLSDRH